MQSIPVSSVRPGSLHIASLELKTNAKTLILSAFDVSISSAIIGESSVWSSIASLLYDIFTYHVLI